ncbi:MAG: hypothetical protein E7573_05910 [Ruminococcaceae bacterium]|nr:hypothetical protein [Oscillospiraceae bacterium]
MNAKRNKLQQNITIVLGLLIGGAIGFLTVLYTYKIFPDESDGLHRIISLLIFLFSMYAGFLLHIIIHEAGHLVFGLLSGYRFSSFRIFSFMILQENGKIKSKKLSVAGTVGQCLMIPPESNDEKKPFVLYNLGGTIMNILVAVFTAVLFFVFYNNAYISIIMLMFSVCGFVIAANNGIPMHIGMVDNDGYNTYSICKNPDSVHAFWFQMKVNELLLKGCRLKDMPEEWFVLPTDEEMQSNMLAAKGVFVCNRLMDMHSFSEAKALILHLLNTDNAITELHRKLLICDLIYINLITFCPEEDILSLLTKEQKKFMKSMKNFPSVLRTEYIVALIFESNFINADKIKKMFEKNSLKYPYPSDIQSERELMDIADSLR